MITNIIITFIATAVLWPTYRLLFSSSNQFQFNRFMLLSMTAFTLVLPFIHIRFPQQMTDNVAIAQNITNYFMLREIAVKSQNAVPQGFDWLQLIAYIYMIGVVVFLAKMTFNILRIYVIAKKNETENIDGVKVVKTKEEHIPYSFLNYIFMPEGEIDPQILRHEMSHVKHHHSLDILFIEIATAFQWFNPFMRLIKKDLQNIHEYTADRDVIDNGADKTDYMMLILQQCTAMGTSARPSASTQIANNFSFSLTKKRIKMITKKEKTKGLIFKALLTAPVFALLLLANCIPNSNVLNAQTVRTYSFEGSKPDITFADPSKINTVDTSGEQSSFDFSYVKNDTVMDFSFWPDEFWYIERKSSDSYNVSFIPKNDSIFLMCEQMPEFPGGEEDLIKFVATNVNYPEQAKDNSIEGRCFVGFIVEPDGSVSNVEIVRGVASAYEEEKPKALAQQCDEEAMRVVKSMPKWKPGMNEGKPVRVHYVLPINFKLK